MKQNIYAPNIAVFAVIIFGFLVSLFGLVSLYSRVVVHAGIVISVLLLAFLYDRKAKEAKETEKVLFFVAASAVSFIIFLDAMYEFRFMESDANKGEILQVSFLMIASAFFTVGFGMMAQIFARMIQTGWLTPAWGSKLGSVSVCIIPERHQISDNQRYGGGSH